ncbi:MAG: hypothetical protein A2Z34_05150 [Planctomycetes bacterium RBG_16_59_8]|nr:MAG: hypothetical protein A2Z34_05150 [Planctomycetes bacterium RBG_16_59_8]
MVGTTGKGGATPVKRIKDVIEAFLRSPTIARRKRFDGIEDAWAFIVGEQLAAATKVAGVRRSVLTVEVESAAVRHELEVLRRDEILERIRTLLPRADIIRVRYQMKSPGGRSGRDRS